MPFEIVVHDDDIVEVVYPPAPTAAEVVDYVARIRHVIDTRPRPWACLVDQRKLLVMPPELMETMTNLNAHAAKHGMKASARIVGSAVADLQAHRMAREGTIGRPIRAFTRRDDALTWLRGL
jgi:hypothetical protein